MATKTVSPPAHQDVGVRAFCSLLEQIEALPEVRKPDFKAGADDSTRYDFDAAAGLIHQALHDAPRGAFVDSLALYLVHVVNGWVPEPDAAWFNAALNVEVSHG